MSPVAVSVHEFLSHGQGIWRTGYSLPICNSSTCQKSIITSLVFPPPLQSHPPCFFHFENHTNSCFSYQAVFLTLLIIPMAFLWAVCLQVVPLRFIAQNWTQYFISQVSSAPLNTFVCFVLFLHFLRTSAWEVASYSSHLTVELCIFIIWFHPFSLQCFPISTRSLWILIISSGRLKIFLSQFYSIFI